MNKEELLQELSAKISIGEISREEVLSRFDFVETAITQTDNKATRRFLNFSMTKMLYVLGATVVVIGIIIFIVQIWGDIASLGRIAITLGFGLLMAAIGSALLKQKSEDGIGAIFHLVGGVLIPLGVAVTLYELKIYSVSPWSLAVIFGIVSLFYLLLSVIHKHPVLTFFTIFNGTTFIYLLFDLILDGPYYRYDDLYAYLTMVVGASYLFLAYAFRQGWNNKLFGLLCFFGSVGFLGAVFSQVFDSVLFQLFYFLILFGALFLSVYMKSRIILSVGTLFLVIHISYITSKHFADSVGWPISLVILGFVFIGLGYVSFSVNRKYIKGNKLI